MWGDIAVGFVQLHYYVPDDFSMALHKLGAQTGQDSKGVFVWRLSAVR